MSQLISDFLFLFPSSLFRLALTWLLRNYELSLATYKVNATIASLKHIHHRLQQQSVSHSPLGHTDDTQLSERTDREARVGPNMSSAS